MKVNPFSNKLDYSPSFSILSRTLQYQKKMSIFWFSIDHMAYIVFMITASIKIHT